jgi:hypothetical protein
MVLLVVLLNVPWQQFPKAAVPAGMYYQLLNVSLFSSSSYT